MKPTIVISNYDDLNNPDYYGGGARAIHEVAKRLSNDYQVKVIVGKYPEARDVIIDNVSYLHVGTYIFGPKIGQIIFQLILPYYAMRLKQDLWIESLTPPISLGILNFTSPSAVIGLIHLLPGPAMRYKYGIPLDVPEKLFLRTYKNFIVLSTYHEGIIRSINKQANITLAPNGVELKKLSNSKVKHDHILFLGRIDISQKGIDLLLKSYKTIESLTKYKLVIAGSGTISERKKVANMISKLNLSNKVSMVGRVDGRVRDRLLKNAACIVIPSRYETQPLTALESLSAKIPLVTYDIPGLRDIPTNIRYVAKNDTTQSLADAIMLATQNDNERQLRTIRGYNYTKQLNWDRTVKKYKLAIDKAIYEK